MPVPTNLSTIQPFLEERHEALAPRFAAFVQDQIASLTPPEDDDSGRRQARQIAERLGTERWPAYAMAQEDGGSEHGPDLRACCLLREALAAASPLADDIFALQCLGTMPLTLAGSESQRRRWLPEVAQGRAIAAFAMTEPQAGSDVAAMGTRARKDGDGWVLEGEKHLISNAGIADVYCVFASTEPQAGHRGLSCFLIPADTPGLSFAGAQILSSPHPLGRIAFHGCRIGSESLVGAEGEGFPLGMRTLDRLRVTVAAAACGMATRALAEALDHAQTRRQFGRPLADFQLTQQKLARMATDLDAARLLTYRAAHQADRSSQTGAEAPTLESAMAKLHATEAAQRIVDDAVQIVGGQGTLAHHPVDRLYRAVRALRIYEGTSEIQHLVIAKHLLRRHADKRSQP